MINISFTVRLWSKPQLVAFGFDGVICMHYNERRAPRLAYYMNKQKHVAEGLCVQNKRRKPLVFIKTDIFWRLGAEKYRKKWGFGTWTNQKPVF